MGTQCCQWPECPGSGDPSQRVRVQVQSVAGTDNRLGLRGGRSTEGVSVTCLASQPRHINRERQQPWAVHSPETGLGYQIMVQLRRERKTAMKRAFYCYLHHRALCFSELRCNCDKRWDDEAVNKDLRTVDSLLNVNQGCHQMIGDDER